MSKLGTAIKIHKELGFRGLIYAISNKLQGKPALYGIIKKNDDTVVIRKKSKISKTNEDYIETAPSVQNVLDIFKGQWSCKIPIENTESGSGDFFKDDKRIPMWNSAYPVNNKTILELGPLEGAHTYQLENLGASSITSIEASRTNYLKCLIVRNLLKLNVDLLHGDFREYLKTCDKKYDIILASGVLYHMTEPAQLLKDIARVTDNLFLSTQYYSEDRHDIYKFEPKPIKIDGKYKGYKHYYVNMDDDDLVLGGTRNYSVWMKKEDILNVLEDVGFSKVVLLEDRIDDPLGNLLTLYAGK